MEKIKKILEGIVREVFLVEIEAEVGLAPELSEEIGATGTSEEMFRADVATNVAMKLVGKLKREGSSRGRGSLNPREVAEKLREEFLKVVSERVSELEGVRVEIAGPGFLNFMLPDGYYREVVQKFCTDFSEVVALDDYKGKVVVTEFSDPNPFKVLHIGHLYTSVVGESMSRLIELAGGEVRRVNFGGDVGLHVAKTIYALKKRGIASSSSNLAREKSGDVLSSNGRAARNALRETPAIDCSPSHSPRENRDFSLRDSNGELFSSFTIDDIAKAYVEGTRAYEEDEGAKGEIVELNKFIYQVAERGEGNYDGLTEEEVETAKLYWKGRELSYKYFVQFYNRIGVEFEKFYPESTVAGRGLAEVKAHMPEVYEESEGAVVFPGEKFGLHTRVFVNKDGLPTYEAKDVGLLFMKYDDYKFDESVVITGNDITEYMKVVLKSVEQYAPELVEKTRHVTHGNVRLPGNEKMSSRKGNFIKAIDVINTVEARLRSTVPSETRRPSRPSLRGFGASSSVVTSGRSQNERVSPLASGAIKYSFLKYKVGGDIEFNIEESVSLTGNSGPYLQYSTVRAKKIIDSSALRESCFRRTQVAPARRRGGRACRTSVVTCGTPPRSNVSLRRFDAFEVKLVRKMIEYRKVLKEAVWELVPHVVCAYLFELAQEFSRFYENCKVVGSEEEEERVKIVYAFERIMEHGLNLLGIEVPEEM